MARLGTSTESSLTSVHHNPPFPPTFTTYVFPLLFHQQLFSFKHTRLDVTLGVHEDLVADRPEQAVPVRLHIDHAQSLFMHGLLERSIGRSLAVFALQYLMSLHIMSLRQAGVGGLAPF